MVPEARLELELQDTHRFSNFWYLAVFISNFNNLEKYPRSIFYVLICLFE